MAKLQDIKTPLLQFEEGDAPATPASGVVRIYAKADGKMYAKDDAGSESALGGSASPLTTKGDVFVYGSAVARLPVGTNGQVLTADSTQGLGVKWGSSAPVEKSISFYIDGVLAVETNAMSIIAPCALTITEIGLAVDVAPTGAGLIIDVNKNGTTMYTTQANRPTVAADGTSATATDPDVTSIAKGDKISIDIDQVGSTVAGENLSAIIICEVV